ncbi:probable sugar dehydrogenase (homolog to aldose sugar dehydrogenase) [Natronomonas pharaonis DSM 2160]|uniref:Probable sugar dehydrogenase (Homolog to aldose sugar dehydrogenase) n=1 Tax=Natronomonas pharaonis (strain ATCC 35678 / DSM 2160 / CIP 103997 / JCM 8858 / NBRC 14720 / NCIMB 2260 / Gabara) TaxID=348780 RepID=A0A1U7ETD4_NATPD|nr:PQQ-dependent sugar dehydrogenase [Natronomonas pharaonis]CAI48154.1 probable sugar dehydrogenase (homolog to aldose sugar dehydrogenase) [Natronomonas pharaonis DSM 2160]
MRRPHSRRQFLVAAGLTVTAAAAGCFDSASEPTGEEPVEADHDLSVDHDIESWDRYDPDWTVPDASPGALEAETVVENLEIPWDLSFASDGECFLTERVGRISRYDGGDLDAVTEPANVIDHATAIDHGDEGGWWATGGEGGLLGNALHPNYPEVPVLYAVYTYEVGDDYRNRLVYFDLAGEEPEETIIIDDIPGDSFHNGSRLVFGPRNYLWVTTGDAGDEQLSADPDRLAGKVLRLNPDGTAPASNPDVGDPRVYSYGHRNAQGLSFMPDGTPIASEHGPAARDEVQIIGPGEDHGWPAVRNGPGVNDEYERYDAADGVTSPLVNTGMEETWAPSGAVFYTGSEVPSLRNRFLVGGLGSQTLYVVTVGESVPDIGGKRYDAPWLHPSYEAVVHERFEDELGRIRHVEQGPDGELYAVTSNRDGRADGPFPTESDDRLVRIVDA